MVLVGPFWPSYTAQIYGRSVAPTPFRTVSSGNLVPRERPEWVTPASCKKGLCSLSLSAEERRAGQREECSGPAPIRWRQNLTLQLRHTTSALGCIFSLNRKCIFVRKARAPTRRPIPQTAYSYRVWITLTKLLHVPLRYFKGSSLSTDARSYAG